MPRESAVVHLLPCILIASIGSFLLAALFLAGALMIQSNSGVGIVGGLVLSKIGLLGGLVYQVLRNQEQRLLLLEKQQSETQSAV